MSAIDDINYSEFTTYQICNPNNRSQCTTTFYDYGVGYRAVEHGDYMPGGDLLHYPWPGATATPVFDHADRNPYAPAYVWDQVNKVWVFDHNYIADLSFVGWGMATGYELAPGTSGVMYLAGTKENGEFYLLSTADGRYIDNGSTADPVASLTPTTNVTLDGSQPDNYVLTGTQTGTYSPVTVTLYDSEGNVIGTQTGSINYGITVPLDWSGDPVDAVISDEFFIWENPVGWSHGARNLQYYMDAENYCHAIFMVAETPVRSYLYATNRSGSWVVYQLADQSTHPYNHSLGGYVESDGVTIHLFGIFSHPTEPYPAKQVWHATGTATSMGAATTYIALVYHLTQSESLYVFGSDVYLIYQNYHDGHVYVSKNGATPEDTYPGLNNSQPPNVFSEPLCAAYFDGKLLIWHWHKDYSLWEYKLESSVWTQREIISNTGEAPRPNIIETSTTIELYHNYSDGMYLRVMDKSTMVYADPVNLTSDSYIAVRSRYCAFRDSSGKRYISLTWDSSEYPYAICLYSDGDSLDFTLDSPLYHVDYHYNSVNRSFWWGDSAKSSIRHNMIYLGDTTSLDHVVGMYKDIAYVSSLELDHIDVEYEDPDITGAETIIEDGFFTGGDTTISTDAAISHEDIVYVDLDGDGDIDLTVIFTPPLTADTDITVVIVGGAVDVDNSDVPAGSNIGLYDPGASDGTIDISYDSGSGTWTITDPGAFTSAVLAHGSAGFGAANLLTDSASDGVLLIPHLVVD